MSETILVCSKCGKTAEFYAALKEGWLHHQRKDAPAGHLVIRCVEHHTPYARRIAGLPQNKTSKYVEDNLDRGLWCEYGDGYVANAYSCEGSDGQRWYAISYHKWSMPAHNVEIIETVPALILAMREVQVNLRKWKLGEVE